MGAILAIFVNKQEKRLRAGWRILIFIIAFIAMAVLAGVVGSNMPGRAEGEAVSALLYLVGGLFAAWVVGRFIDRRRFAAFGFHLSGGWLLDLLFGLVLGVVLMGGIFLSMRQAGWIEVTRVSANDLAVPLAVALGVKLVTFTAVGVNEELAFRGYWLRNLSEGISRLGPRTAIVTATLVTSGIFGVAHFANELSGGAHTSGIATMNLILAGLMLAVPFLITGELAIPIGIHITWNYLQGPIFGFPVSGIEDTTHLITVADRGPEYWTGGDYGPEGGLIATVWMGVGIVLILLWVLARRRKLAIETDIATYTPR
jgi:membrane protease YdiL (CAAX protease family)